ncbi:MAG: formylglycine-generating enzyme family protein [Nitrospina sp.]|jgi:formylglycine-generating enzyme|nr:formylglycine-generating enzyme family protein [Nitrospina sp.]
MTRYIIFYLLSWVCWAFPVIAQESKVHDSQWVSPSTGMEFIRIPAGCSMMGTENGFDFESPVHKICVDEFYLGKFEVTQEQWDQYLPDNFSKFTGKFRPVERVSWNDAKIYIQELNNEENTEKYRLPYEAEWEYAARGGTTTQFYWGDKIDDSYVWYFGTSNYKTHPVGLKKPNPFGLYDMLGNVWEWVEDWFANDYYQKSPIQNPEGPETGRFKVKRGGSQANLISHIKSHTRYRADPDKRHHINGFRVAFSPDKL